MYEKLIWICAFMIVGVKHGGCTVGEVEKAHNTEVQAIITDLAQAVTKVLNTALLNSADIFIFRYRLKALSSHRVFQLACALMREASLTFPLLSRNFR